MYDHQNQNQCSDVAEGQSFKFLTRLSWIRPDFMLRGPWGLWIEYSKKSEYYCRYYHRNKTREKIIRAWAFLHGSKLGPLCYVMPRTLWWQTKFGRHVVMKTHRERGPHRTTWQPLKASRPLFLSPTTAKQQLPPLHSSLLSAEVADHTSLLKLHIK